MKVKIYYHQVFSMNNEEGPDKTFNGYFGLDFEFIHSVNEYSMSYFD